MSTHILRAEIAGAGIAGLTAATALAKKGWRVRLHEANSEIRAFGAGIYLWSNGLAVLDEFDVLEQAIEGAHHGREIQSRDSNGEIISRISINAKDQPQVLTILRERLIAALLTAAEREGVEIIKNSLAVGASPEGQIKFADGSSAQADLVVAADGVASRVRDSLNLLSRRSPIGQRCARLLVPRRSDLVDTVDEDQYIEYLSGSRFLLYTPSSAADLYVALVASSLDTSAMGGRVPHEEWIKSFPFLENLIRQLGPVNRWDDFEWVELSSWSRGKSAVIGDAAHAQPPYLGQGGGCAMMSALALADFASSGSSIAHSLHRWEASVRPIIQHTQRYSVRVAQLNDVPDTPRRALMHSLAGIPRIGTDRMKAALTTPDKIVERTKQGSPLLT